MHNDRFDWLKVMCLVMGAVGTVVAFWSLFAMNFDRGITVEQAMVSQDEDQEA